MIAMMRFSCVRRLIIPGICLILLIPACARSETNSQIQPLGNPSELLVSKEGEANNQPVPLSKSQNEPSPMEQSPEITLLPPSDTATVTIDPGAKATQQTLPTATSTLISSPTHIPKEIPASTHTPLPTSTATNTPLPKPALIEGQILFKGKLLTEQVNLVLENQAYQVIQETTTTNGKFRFENLPTSFDGYNILFSQAKNPQFNSNEIINWAWIGPIAVQDGFEIRLSDIEIGLVGLLPVNPAQDAIINTGPISPINPLVFEWTPYPSASQYWLDLRSANDLQVIWQSGLLNSNTITFDGVLANGNTIQPGSYWWQVSARVNDSFFNISGPLRSFYLNR